MGRDVRREIHSAAVSFGATLVLRQETWGETVTVLDNVRVFNKRLLNPLMMRLAGRKHWYASAIETPGDAPASTTRRRS